MYRQHDTSTSNREVSSEDLTMPESEALTVTTKLELVQKALRENPAIKIVGERECNYLPHRDGYWSHTVDIHVAPVEPIYTASGLQELMMSLVPGLVPTTKDDFYEYTDSMQFGKLYFDEDIGTEIITRELTLTDPAMFGAAGFESGKRTIREEKRFQRRTWVVLFPDIEIASAAFSGDINRYKIEKGFLSERRRMLLA